MCILRLERRLWLPIITIVAIFLVISKDSDASQTSSITTDRSKVERCIQRLQDGLLPLVVVKGEDPQTTKLSDRMSELKVPGVSIAVIRDGEIDWARGFGVDRTGGSPVTTATLFQAASISKPVTALAVLRLVESGKLDLDVDVNQYLKSWKIPTNNFTDQSPVTLRRLLTHTAGMTVHGFTGYPSGAPTPNLLQVLNGAKPANNAPVVVDTVPGKTRRYSGGGYIVIQQLLVDLTLASFPKLMKDLVLSPIGMNDSTFEQPLPKDKLLNAAMPHRSNGESIQGGPHIYPEMAAAGLWTTPSDLAEFALDLQASLSGASKHVLSKEMVGKMLLSGEYGLGMNVGGSKQQPYFSHGGSNTGFRCNLVAYCDGEGAVIMTNSDTGGQLATEILYTISREYEWPDFKPTERTAIALTKKELVKFTGTYQMAPSKNIMITLEGNQLMGQVSGQDKVPLFPESETTFFLKVRDAEIEFLIDDSRKVTHLVLIQNGGALKVPRIMVK